MSTAYKPRYVTQKSGTGLSGYLIHEDPDQSIQGGSIGEHYHLTKAEWERRVSYLEPLASSTAQVLHSINGDILMSKVFYAP